MASNKPNTQQQSQSAADYNKVIAQIFENTKKLRLQIQLKTRPNKWLDVYNRCTTIKDQINDVPGLLKEEQFKAQNSHFKNEILDSILYMILTRLKDLYDDIKNINEEAVDGDNIDVLNKTIQNTIANVMKLRIEKLEQKTKSETNNCKWYSVNKFYQIETDIDGIADIIPDVHKKAIQFDFQDLFLKLLDKRVNELESNIQTQDKGHYGWHITFSKYNDIIKDIANYKHELNNKLVILEQRIKLIKTNIDKKYSKNKIRYKYDIAEAKHFIGRYQYVIKYFKGSADNPKYKQLFFALTGFKKDLSKSNKVRKYKTLELIDEINDLINTLNSNVNKNENAIGNIDKSEAIPMTPNTSIIEWNNIVYEVEFFTRLVKEISRKSYVEEAKLKSVYNSNDISIDITYLNLNHIIYSMEALVFLGQLVPTATYIDEVYRRIKYSIPVVWKECSQFIQKYTIENEASGTNEEVDREILQTNVIAVSAQINNPRISAARRVSPYYNCDEEQYLKDLMSFNKMPEKQDSESLKRQFQVIEVKIQTLRETITRFLDIHLQDTENHKLEILKDIKERAKDIYTRVEEFNGTNNENEDFNINYDITSLKLASESILPAGDIDVKDKRKSVVELLNELTDLYDAKCTNLATNLNNEIITSQEINTIEENSSVISDKEIILTSEIKESSYSNENEANFNNFEEEIKRDSSEDEFNNEVISKNVDLNGIKSIGSLNSTFENNIIKQKIADEEVAEELNQENIIWTENKLISNNVNGNEFIEENLSTNNNETVGEGEKNVTVSHNKIVEEKYTKSTDEDGNIIWEQNVKEEIFESKRTTTVEHVFTGTVTKEELDKLTAEYKIIED